MATSNIPPATAAWAQSRFGRPQRPEEYRRGRAKPNIDFLVGKRVMYAASCSTYERKPDDPVYRPLRIFALDPAASVRDGALSVVNVPYEPIESGPTGLRGAILEIVGDNPGGGLPLDLDDKFLLMQQGRLQSPEDPLFRQQMVYAVCTTTYAAFRHALGRDIAWGFRHPKQPGGARLRVRPTVSNLQNAFYDRSRGELCFGSFQAGGIVAGRNTPHGQISLCLSHDIVVHEMSHALLDGLRSHFLFPSNPDVLAFHEAFADLIAIFQRFTYRDVVLSAMRQSRAEISSSALLTNIGTQFAQATFLTNALRSAINPAAQNYGATTEPHHRGECLVAAVFDAFTTIFERRTSALLRLSTNGTGLLPPGQIPDVLATQLTDQACRLASQFLTICIRAIDYCPPIDITFGEFLRAVLSADLDLVPNDDLAYREAWIEAFAKARIYPVNVPSLSESALIWRCPEKTMPPEPELSFAQLQFDGDPGRVASGEEAVRQAMAFGQLAADRDYLGEFGLCRPDDAALDGDAVDLPVVESVRSSRRVGPSGQIVFDLVAEITQRRVVKARGRSPSFEFFGGATAILDPRGRVRFVIRKSILDETRVQRQREFLQAEGSRYFGPGPEGLVLPEPKLLLKLHDLTRPQSQKSAASRQFVRGLDSTPRGELEGYYLRKGASGSAVTLLKACLRKCMNPVPMLDDSPVFDAATERAINDFQCSAGITVDGIVGPVTWTALAQRLKYRPPETSAMGEVPTWIARLLKRDPAIQPLGPIDLPGALELYEFGYGPLSQSQRTGLSNLMTSLTTDPEVTDLRWAAYMLATVKHECADTWRPIEEFGKGAGRAYGDPETVVDSDGIAHSNAYYGRGYVQLTWKYNYAALSQALNMGNQLVISPELALDPPTAYRILSYGMRTGSFTGKRLSHYIGTPGADYVNARRIINGTDQAEKIAGYAGQMETLLLANVNDQPPTSASST